MSSYLQGEEVAVVVSDNGTGISDNVLTSIFNPYLTTRDGALGVGLGLPLAADVARRTRAALARRSRAARGTADGAGTAGIVLPGVGLGDPLYRRGIGRGPVHGV